MAGSKLLKILKRELDFFDTNGYGLPFRSSWRPTLLFRDSSVCLNFSSSQPLQPCSNCRLFKFVPVTQCATLMPCHHIPLNRNGDTIASLYRSGTQQQLDAAFHQWLRSTIEKSEKKETAHEDS